MANNFEVDFKTYSPDEFDIQQDKEIPNFRISASVVAYHKPTDGYVRSHIGKSQLENRYYALTALISMLDLQAANNEK